MDHARPPADADPTPQQVAAELRPALSLLYRRIRRSRVPGDLTLPESSALGKLDRHGPATGAQLAKLEEISPQSIGATLQSLEAKRLVTRAPDPEDGRRVVLSLTDAGRDILRSKRTARTEQLTRALGALTAEERGTLLAAVPLLERLGMEL